ncbi:hypothetical protein TNCV_4366021 [Trichonephila clavipes]|nr:hypothetical protein TNCV_4366021 [Trichonephila clavipes]
MYYIKLCASSIQTPTPCRGHGSLAVKVTDSWLVFKEFEASTPEDRNVGERCTLNRTRAQTSSRWCGVVARRSGTNSGVVLVSLE